MEEILKQRLFNINNEGLIERFNKELMSVFTNMKAHPDPFYKVWFSTYPYRRHRGGLCYAENHFRINFYGLTKLWIQANVIANHGWYYEVEEWYSFYDGREYNKDMTLNDLVIIFERHKVDTQVDLSRAGQILKTVNYAGT
jgi:hypothetical protein